MSAFTQTEIEEGDRREMEREKQQNDKIKKIKFQEKKNCHPLAFWGK